MTSAEALQHFDELLLGALNDLTELFRETGRDASKAAEVVEKRGESLDSYHHLQWFGIFLLSKDIKSLEAAKFESYDEKNKKNIAVESDSNNQSYTDNLNDQKDDFMGEKAEDPHESMVDVAARIRRLAPACYFGTALEMCFTDCFVLGLDRVKTAREKLFREVPNQLKLNKALEVACAVKGALRIVSAGDSAFRELIKFEPLLYTDWRRIAPASGHKTVAPVVAATPESPGVM
ncbi:unnamed protein product [Parnassius apollo]|uniref:(apollo) hypothetical protein n=1 Tax=Parnassius apollo TaxID=110799 RepID=A0A8S3XBS9_PARAO|nr:unnamed protein product [Parnassius apollo]